VKTKHQTTSKPGAKQSIDLDEVQVLVGGMLADGDAGGAVELLINLLRQLHSTNDRQALQLAELMRKLYGSQSEKVDAAQLKLFLQAVGAADRDAAQAADDAPLPSPPVEPAPTPRKRTGRNKLPEDLPRKVEELDPPAEERVCAICGADKVCIGHETSEILEFVPASFLVIEQRRRKYACKPCGNGVTIALPGDKPIENGRPGPGLLAQLAVGKYQDHLPLNRQVAIFKRLGVTLPSSTLVSWIEAVATAFEPIYRELVRRTLLAQVLGVDDTVLKVLDKKKAKGIKRGHIWSYVGYEEGRPIRAVYDYTPDWSGEGPQTFLATRLGYIQGDGYKGIDALFKNPEAGVRRVGCWAHVRRGFVKALDAGDKRAAVAVKLIGKLYEVERLASEREDGPEERAALRDEYARPVADRLGTWIKETWPDAVPKSPLGKAVTYAVNQWPTLTVYLEDGAVPIDNNEVERRIRPVAVGRKNYLFAGSDSGGERAAVIYSILACCNLAKVEPFAYMRDVLDRLSKSWPASRLSELLPENWSPTTAEAAGDAAGADSTAAPA
jgi:transposase